MLFEDLQYELIEGRLAGDHGLKQRVVSVLSTGDRCKSRGHVVWGSLWACIIRCVLEFDQEYQKWIIRIQYM